MANDSSFAYITTYLRFYCIYPMIFIRQTVRRARSARLNIGFSKNRDGTGCLFFGTCLKCEFIFDFLLKRWNWIMTFPFNRRHYSALRLRSDPISTGNSIRDSKNSKLPAKIASYSLYINQQKLKNSRFSKLKNEF